MFENTNVEKHMTSTNFLVWRLMTKLQKLVYLWSKVGCGIFSNQLRKMLRAHKSSRGKPKNEIIQKGLVSDTFYRMGRHGEYGLCHRLPPSVCMIWFQ